MNERVFIFKVNFASTDAADNWISASIDVLAQDGEEAISKVKRETEKRDSKFKLLGLELLAQANL